MRKQNDCDDSERIGNAEGFATPIVATVLSIGLLFSFAGAVTPALAASKWPRKRQIVAAYAVLFLSIFAVGNHPGVWTYAVALCAYNFFFSFVIPLQTAWIAESDATGRNAVLVPVAQGVGVSIGPLLAGSLMADIGWVAGACFAVLLLSFWLSWRLRDPLLA